LKLDLEALKGRFRNIKLLVTDIDGTLLNREGEIGPETVRILKKLSERNVLLTFATQRVHSSIVPLAEKLGVKIPFIASNGSLIQDTAKNCIYKSTISPKKVERALELAAKHYVKIVFCYNDVIVYTENNSVIKDFMNRYGTTYELVDSYRDYKDNVLEIIMSGNEKEVIKSIQRKMNFPFRIFLKARYFRSQTHRGVYNLEISRAGINKRTGLEKLTAHLKIKKEEVAVFGDWYNDRDLFDFGATNIALQNAVPELKNKAHFITEHTNDEDGVGRLLGLIYE
jgi:Cof subfamily protein (haloacid dehalogenase superfamily)